MKILTGLHIKKRDRRKHISSDECAEGQADTATVWSGHTCSCTQIWSTLQHRLTRIQTGRASKCCVWESDECLGCIHIPYPIVWPLCVWEVVASSRQASWKWCLQVSVAPRVLLWWCPLMVSQDRLPGCSQVASFPAGQPWWDELTRDEPGMCEM